MTEVRVEPPEELTEALVTAVGVALREMAGIASARAPGAIWAADVLVVLPVTTASGSGTFALALAEADAVNLARCVLASVGAEVEPDDGLVRDCVAEVVNVIAGQAKTLLLGTRYHFALSTPRVEAGAVAGFVLTFATGIGELALHVHLPV